MSEPAIVMLPLVGSSRPATIRSVVVLPQPEGPSSAKNRPCSTTRSRSSTAVNTPNRLVTPLSLRSAPASLPVVCSVTTSGSDHRGELLLVALLGLLVQAHEVLGL